MLSAKFCSQYSHSFHLELQAHLIVKFALNIQGKICNIVIHCDFQCSFHLDVLNRCHVILQLFPGELGITGYLTACITPCTEDGRPFNCFICAKWESSKELRNDGTLPGIEMCGNMLGKLLNVFDKGGEGRRTSETFQWEPEHFAWEILWHCLLGTVAQRWCSSLCSLTRLDVSSFFAANQWFWNSSMSQEKCLKFLLLPALLVKDLA